jgi:hypothetical protein
MDTIVVVNSSITPSSWWSARFNVKGGPARNAQIAVRAQFDT